MITTKTDTLMRHTFLSISIIGIGLILLTYMITVESEPGAIPLFLILIGSIWLFATRRRNRNLNGGK